MIKFIKKLFRKLFFRNQIPKNLNFGYVKDTDDNRDFKFKITVPKDLPRSVDLTPNCPIVYNQGKTGSCTANALGTAYQYEQIKQGKKNFIPSRLFVYYNEREIEGTVNEDSGAMLRTGIKTMVKDGVCPEVMWKYNESKFKIKPSKNCYEVALDNQVLKYLRVQQNSLYEVKHCLFEGFPVVLGIMLHDSFMSRNVAKTGRVPIPHKNDGLIGGHAVTIVGYDDAKTHFIVRNSWGKKWGDKGNFYLPYSYITNPSLSADYWTIRLVE